MSAQSQSAPGKLSPQIAMLQMISGFWISRLIYLVAKLGIPDHLQDGARTAAELANATATHAPSLFRVLRALASVGVFAAEGELPEESRACKSL